MHLSDAVVSQTRKSQALEFALGPVAELLLDGAVIEVMLNADGALWVERFKRGMARSPFTMRPTEAEHLLRLVAAAAGLELNQGRPALTAKLPPPFAARIQAAIPPIVDAPVFTIRKMASKVFSLREYVQAGVLSDAQHAALLRAVDARANILVGGGTGSGKTTFTNALLQVVSERTNDRIYIIEDTPELQCSAPNKVQVLVQPEVYTWREAVAAAMRHRPDRIVVGEVRDGAALELLKAWNTGHPGGLATIHANDTHAMLDRVCQLIEEVVHPAPRALVAQTITVCVHLQRDPSKKAGRSISGLVEVAGISAAGEWQLAEIA